MKPGSTISKTFSKSYRRGVPLYFACKESKIDDTVASSKSIACCAISFEPYSSWRAYTITKQVIEVCTSISLSRHALDVIFKNYLEDWTRTRTRRKERRSNIPRQSSLKKENVQSHCKHMFKHIIAPQTCVLFSLLNHPITYSFHFLAGQIFRFHLIFKLSSRNIRMTHESHALNTCSCAPDFGPSIQFHPVSQNNQLQ